MHVYANKKPFTEKAVLKFQSTWWGLSPQLCRTLP